MSQISLHARRTFVTASIAVTLLLGFAIDSQQATSAPVRSGHATAAPMSRARAAAVRQAVLDRKERAIASAVLHALNVERQVHHLPKVAMNGYLIRSAHAHNVTMARHNSMSHQLPGEAYFATRIDRAGYNWRTAGENIGWNSDRSKAGALYLQHLMYMERPPNDGHRRNILSRSFRHIGIDIYIDARTGKLWLTEDFGSPM